MENIIEEKKYYELTFRAPIGDYFKVKGAFTEEELEQCLNFHQGYGQSKCISIHDEESLGLPKQ